MKFATDQDAKLFLIEVGKLDEIDSATKSLQPDEDMLELFLHHRRNLIPGLKDFRRRQNTKKQWRHERFKMLRGIRRFHKSTTGKKFHRSLGRFIATRESLTKNEVFYLTEIADILKALSSLKTHAYIELEFYHPLTEELEYRLLFEELIPLIDQVEKKLLSGDFTLEQADEELLLRIVDWSVLKECLSKHYELDLKTIEAIESQIMHEKNVKEMDEDDMEYFTTIFHTLQDRLNNTCNNTA